MTMPKRLSPQHKIILRYIVEHSGDHGFPPSVRQIARVLRLSSGSTICFHLDKLEAWGLITRVRNCPRTLVVTPLGREMMKETIPPAV